MSQHQVRLADVLGKHLDHFYVPADGAAVSFVFREGRMSLGAPQVRAAQTWQDAPADIGTLAEASVVTAVDYPEPKPGQANRLTLVTDKGLVVVDYEGATYLVELPE